jgi:adenylate cyclase
VDAIEACLAIQHGLEALNSNLAADGAPAMHMRIGVHSGDVLAGSMGSSERLEYAVIGDTVNCASRLESYEKTRQTNICRVLVSSATRDLLSPARRDALLWDYWGSLQVKGRQEPLDVWELRGSAPAESLATQDP